MWACSATDEAGRIRERIRQGAALAEDHDLAGLLELTTPGFRAEPGDRDGDGVRETLAMAFYHYQRFQILHPRPAVELAEDRATASAAVPFLVVRRDRSYPGLADLAADPAAWLARVGENADLYHLELQLLKQDGEWLATSATLRGAGGIGR
ncbi:MAG: hypothetical protein P1P84_13670 [Deferrisomatales bacterium]|nr:hypothetical protein [Deferrisomatales bacterium]